MKKRLLLLIILCSFQVIAYGQDFSLTDQGNEWIYDFYTFCGDDSCDDGNGAFALRINGVETINELEYAILEIYSYQNPNEGWNSQKFLREENGIVYEYIGDQNETIYLDFTLEIGDEVSFPIEYSEDTTPVVTDVSTQSIAGEMRKVITFNIENLSDSAYSEFQTIIEGIGFTGDPNAPFLSNADFSTDISCFSGSTGSFGDCAALSADTYVITSTTLYPNPILHTSILKFDASLEIDQVQFFTAGGKLLQKHIVKNHKLELYKDDFVYGGIYLYRCLSSGQVRYANKFIVQ